MNFNDKYNSTIAKAYRDKLDIETEGGTWEEPDEFVQIRQNIPQNDTSNENQEEDQILLTPTPSPSIWAREEERSEPLPNNTNPTRRGGRLGIRVGGKVKAQENSLDPNLNYTPPFTSESLFSHPASSLFTGLVLNDKAKSQLDNNETYKLNNNNNTHLQENGVKSVDSNKNNISPMDQLNPSFSQNQNLFAMEINPFNDTSGNTQLSTPSNIQADPDPFSLSNHEQNENLNGISKDNLHPKISEIDPFQITPIETPTPQSDNTPSKLDTQPRSLFSPEYVRDPFGLAIEEESIPAHKETILGKIGKFFFKK